MEFDLWLFLSPFNDVGKLSLVKAIVNGIVGINKIIGKYNKLKTNLICSQICWYSSEEKSTNGSNRVLGNYLAQ